MFYEKDLIKAKSDIEQHIGSNVRVRFNNGKRREKTKDGVILSAYKSIFLVKLKITGEQYTKTAYTYSDLLTENVVITII